MLLDSRHYLTRQLATESQFVRSETLLGGALRDFLADLTMTDGEVVMSCVLAEQHANLADLIQSSSELVVKPGHLRYANSAAVDFDWGRPPSVAIAMELAHNSLTAFFRVVFEELHVGLDMRGILFREPAGNEEENLRRFSLAVADTLIAGSAPRFPPEVAGASRQPGASFGR